LRKFDFRPIAQLTSTLLEGLNESVEYLLDLKCFSEKLQKNCVR